MSIVLPLITEGEWSLGGTHYVRPGSVTWREPPLPVTRPSSDGTYVSEIIGKITRVWREDNVIMGEFEMLDDEQPIKSITVDTNKGAYSLNEDSNGMLIDHPEIMGGCGWTDNRYLWRDDD